MSHFSHVLLAGSLIIGQQALAQTTPNSPPADKVTTQAFTANTNSKVQDIVTATKNSTLPAFSNSTSMVNNLVTPPDDERRYNIAVENVQREIAGKLSMNLGDSGTRLGLGNNTIGAPSGALVITNKLSLDDRKAYGKVEMGIGDNKLVFIQAKINF